VFDVMGTDPPADSGVAPLMDVRDAVVLVTGASGAIGAQCARQLAARGARLVLTAHDSDLAELCADIGATAIVSDLSRPGAVDRLAAEAVDTCGAVDAVVHCAGLGWRGESAAMDAALADLLLDVNLRVPVQLTRALLPGMLARRRGHVAFVASIAGWLGVPSEAVYSGAKSGVITYAASLRTELVGTGVGVSVVSPAAVRTNFFANRGSPYDRRIPRLLPAEKVAAVIVRGIVSERAHQMVPRWLAVAPAVRAVAPPLYRTMLRRFGQ
jgi:short-subunit dehydrogenase